MGTKSSIISGPYDLGAGGGGGGGGTTTVTINKINWPSTITVGSNLKLSIDWSSVRGEDKEPTGDGTIYVSVNDKQVLIKTNVAQGRVDLSITAQLNPGANTVQVKVIDAYGTTSTTAGLINAVTLELKSNFNYLLPYPLAGTTGINFTYIPYGSVEKTVHFILNDTEIGTQVVNATGEQQTYFISGLSHGAHILEVYFTAIVDDELVQSNKLRYALIYHIAGDTTPIIASDFNDLEQEQYIAFNIPYRVYAENKNEFEVTLSVNGTRYAQLVVNATEQQ